MINPFFLLPLSILPSKKKHIVSEPNELSIKHIILTRRNFLLNTQSGKTRYSLIKVTNLCTNARSDWCHITGIILLSSRNLIKWATVASSTRYGKAYFFSKRSFIKKLQWFTKETLSSSFQSIWQRRRGRKRNNNKKSLLLYEISLNHQLIDSINHNQSKESKQLIMNKHEY